MDEESRIDAVVDEKMRNFDENLALMPESTSKIFYLRKCLKEETKQTVKITEMYEIHKQYKLDLEKANAENAELKRERDLSDKRMLDLVAWPAVRSRIEYAELLFSSPVSTFPDFLDDRQDDAGPSKSRPRKRSHSISEQYNKQQYDNQQSNKLHPMGKFLIAEAKEHVKSWMKGLNWDAVTINTDLSGNFKKHIMHRYKMWIWIFASSDFKMVDFYRKDLGCKEDMSSEEKEQYAKSVFRFCKSIAIIYSVASQRIHCAPPIPAAAYNYEQIKSAINDVLPDPSVHQVVRLLFQTATEDM